MTYAIGDLFEHAVDLMPDRTALLEGDRRLTYAELDKRANRLAHHLLHLGVRPTDKVAVYSRNRIEAIESMIAIYKIRAVMVNVNFRYVADELRYLLDNSDSVAVIVERRYADVLTEALPDCPQVRQVLVVEDDTSGPLPEGPNVDVVSYEDALAAQSDERGFQERSNDDIYMLYTGGTTGNPKGVMWRHEDVFMVLGGGINFITGEAVADDWEIAKKSASEDPITSYALPPLIHGGAQWALFIALFAGRCSVLEREFEPHKVWENVQRFGVSLLFITGDAMARPLIEAYDPEKYDASSLVYIGSSAALFSPAVKEQFLDAFPHAFITDNIGATETGFSGMSTVAKGEENHGGPRVMIDRETQVLGADGKPVEPGSGQVGKLARTGHIPIGYYNDEKKTAETFVYYDGVRWSIPGDDARVEADGTVIMLGRGSASINSGGEKVHPEEVEGALKAHPDIFDALVIGVPDERMGHRVAAVLETRDGLLPPLEEINEIARKTIARYKCPRSIWVEPKVMRSPAGKPDYSWAKQVAASRPADEHQEIPQ